MPNGHPPQTTADLAFQLDRYGCEHGRETRRKLDEIGDLDKEGCIYGQDTRRRFERLERTLSRVFWLMVAQILLSGGAILVWLVTRA